MAKFHAFVSSFLGIVCLLCVLTVPTSAQAPATKVMGTVKSVSGDGVVVTLDSGTDATVTFTANARIVRATPGQADLKSASPIQVSDIQPGDRLVAKAQAGEGGALLATTAVVMSKTDITQKQQHERDEWRRGVGGIVKEVNIAAGTITIPNSLAAAGKPIVIHISPKADIRRYSPDSVKFEDAKPSTLDQIKPGDQVRARGTKNEDGTDFTAQAIVSGSFRELAATVISTDTASNSVTLTDLATKKPVTVKIGPDSTAHKLPQFLAMGVAICMKGGTLPVIGAPPAQSTTSANSPSASRQDGRGPANGQQGPAAAGGHTSSQGSSGGSGGFRGGNGRPPDCQQLLSRMPDMLARMPAMPITDLNKGDAVMLVAGRGSTEGGLTAITLLAGVEPILTAAPPGMNAAATVLSPWNLGQGGGAGTGGGGDAVPGQ